jgi:predicted dehydrogenase
VKRVLAAKHVRTDIATPWPGEQVIVTAAMWGEKELLVKPEQCYQAQRIMDAIYESAATEREVVFS